jgi:hypothetical protein
MQPKGRKGQSEEHTRLEKRTKSRFCRERLPEPARLAEVDLNLLEDHADDFGRLDLTHDVQHGQDRAEATGRGCDGRHTREREKVEENGVGLELDKILAV